MLHLVVVLAFLWLFLLLFVFRFVNLDDFALTLLGNRMLEVREGLNVKVGEDERRRIVNDGEGLGLGELGRLLHIHPSSG